MKSMVLFKLVMVPLVILHLTKGWDIVIAFIAMNFNTLSHWYCGQCSLDQHTINHSFRNDIPTVQAFLEPLICRDVCILAEL